MNMWQKIIPYVYAEVPLPQSPARTTTFRELVTGFGQNVLDPLVVLIFGVALVYFLVGVIKFISAADDPKIRTEGKNMMIYGIIALAVMVSVWGLVKLVTGTFNLDSSTPPGLPTFP